MKNIFFKLLIFLAAINISTKSFSQWETVYFPDTVFTLPLLNSVYFTDYNNGMAAGYRSYWVDPPFYISVNFDGLIMRTTDNGTNWDTVLFIQADSTIFYKIVFTNANTAFAVGKYHYCSGIIAKTTDSGDTWDTTITSSTLSSISFPVDSIGYAVGINGTILKTTDAGLNWITQNSNVTNYLYSVFFLNDSIGFASGDSIVLKTTDGGNNWTSQVIGSNIYSMRIFFPSDSIGYILSFEDNIYKTIDSGNNWFLQTTIPPNPGLCSIFFTDDTTGYIPGLFIMLKTIDGGLTWSMQSSSPPS